MSPHPPTLRQLRYLTALFESGHFGKAAKACHVTQSTLSTGLRELEALLGASLVERTKRAVRFTPLGERVAAKAYEVLRQADELVDLVTAAGEPLASELRMGVIPTIAPFYLPKVLPALRAAYPKLKLYLKEDMSHVICEGLNRGQLDVLLLALPYACGDVETAHLFNDPFYAGFRPEDMPEAAAAPQTPVSPAALTQHRLLLLEEGHCLKDHALAACAHPALSPDEAILGTSLHTLVQMVDNHLGVTLLPKLAIDGGILQGTGLVVRPLAGSTPYREIGLIWRQGSPRAAEYHLLADFLRKLGQEAPKPALAS
ncbi:MAG: hydrogen peroxide-inducible genes activator [Sphingomonadales bacterium]